LFWRNGLFAWESEHVTQLLGAVQLSSSSINLEDKWVWKDDDRVEYSINSVYDFLKSMLEGDSSSLYNYFWKIKALPSAHITFWRVLENKIATKINLVRRGVAVDSSICCFCREKEETTSHLFFECRFAWLVCNLYYAWIGLKSVDHLECTSHFLHFNLIDTPAVVNLVFLKYLDCFC